LTRNLKFVRKFVARGMKKVAIITIWIAEESVNKTNQKLEQEIREDIEKEKFPWLGKIEKVSVLEAP
jgi:ribosomal protein L31E